MGDASASQDTQKILVEFALFLVVQVNSLIREDALSAL